MTPRAQTERTAQAIGRSAKTKGSMGRPAATAASAATRSRAATPSTKLHAGSRRTFEIFMQQGLDNAVVLDEIAELADEARVPVRLVSAFDLDYRARSEVHQGVIAIAEPLQPVDLEALIEGRKTPPFLLVLDGVTDPHNLGAVLRSRAGSGCDRRRVAEAPLRARHADRREGCRGSDRVPRHRGRCGCAEPRSNDSDTPRSGASGSQPTATSTSTTSRCSPNPSRSYSARKVRVCPR